MITVIFAWHVIENISPVCDRQKWGLNKPSLAEYEVFLNVDILSKKTYLMPNGRKWGYKKEILSWRRRYLLTITVSM